jgi:hypothetical protein
MRNFQHTLKIIIVSLFIFPFFTYAATTDQCFDVSGFGSTTANGIYSYEGTTNNSQPVFWNGSTTRPWYLASAGIDSGYWVLRTFMSGINADYASPYYNSDSYSSEAYGHTWANQSGFGGNTPNGTVSLETCPTEGGGATSTTGTYDGPNFKEWLFVIGIGIFFLSFMAWPHIFRPFSTLFKPKI